MRKGRIIDSHAHLVQYIAGTGAGGELRSIGNGMAVYANGQTVRMIPKEFGGDQVTPEHLLQVMDKNGVEKAVLLQGNFYGYQNYYTHLAVKKYPDRFAGAGAYDPFSRDKDGIRRYLFEELGFKIEKFEVSTGSGLMAIHPELKLYANGQTVRMIPKEFGGDQVTPEHLLQVMDKNGVEKAVLLQGNFYGYQNYYTHLAVKKYPDRFAGAGAYDPFSRDKDGIRRYLFEELGFKIEKFEVSTGSGLMAIHPELKLDGPVMDEACSYACDHGHVFVIDIGKCGSDSWQVPELCNLVKRYPEMKFVACHLLAPSNKDKDRLRWALEQLQLPNLWFDLSSVVHNCRPDEYPYPKAIEFIQLAKEMVGAEKLMFGTDFPSALKEDVYGHYVGYIADSTVFTDQEKEQIFYENAYGVYFNHH